MGNPPRDGGRGVEWHGRYGTLRLFSWRHGFATYRGAERAWFARWGIAQSASGLIGLSFGRNEDGDPDLDVGLWPLWLNVWTCRWPRQNGSKDPQS